MSNDKIINFPENKIVRNLNSEKPKESFHKERIEELIRRLEHEITMAYYLQEIDEKIELVYEKILPLQRKDGKHTKFRVVVHPTGVPF